MIRGSYKLVRIEYKRTSGSGPLARYSIYENTYGVGTNNFIEGFELEKGLTLKQARDRVRELRDMPAPLKIDSNTDFFVDMKPDKRPTIWDLQRNVVKKK